MAWLVAAMWASLNVVRSDEPAVARGPERHPLRRVVRVRGAVVVGGEQGVDVDEVFGLRLRSGAGVGRHADSLVAAAGRPNACHRGALVAPRAGSASGGEREALLRDAQVQRQVSGARGGVGGEVEVPGRERAQM